MKKSLPKKAALTHVVRPLQSTLKERADVFLMLTKKYEQLKKHASKKMNLPAASSGVSRGKFLNTIPRDGEFTLRD